LGSEECKGPGSGLFYERRKELSRDITAYDRNFDIYVGRAALE
jgi:hypothetical protein